MALLCPRCLSGRGADILSFHVYMKEMILKLVIVVYILCVVVRSYAVSRVVHIVFALVGYCWVVSVVPNITMNLSLTHSSAARIAFCEVGLVVI